MPGLVVPVAKRLSEAGRHEDAAERLDRLLDARPESAKAAMARASQLLAADPMDARGLALSERAVRFAGNDQEEAYQALASVLRGRGEPEKAEELLTAYAEAKVARAKAIEEAAARRVEEEKAEAKDSDGATPGSSS